MPPRSVLQAALRVDTTSSAMRSTPTRPISTVKATRLVMRSASSSTQLGAEAGSHGQHHAAGARGGRSLARACPRGRAAPRPTTGCPTRASDSQVSRTASRGTSRAAWSASITLGPPGWQTHQPMSVARQVVVGQERVDVVAQVALDQSRHLGVQHDPQAAAGDVEAHRPLAVGVEPAAGVEHLDRSRPAGRRRRPRPRRRRRRRARWRPGWAPTRRRAARSASTARPPPATAVCPGWPSR